MMRLAILTSVIIAALAPAAIACDLIDVCSDTRANLGGWIIHDGLRPGVERVRLEWMTDAEQRGTIAAYLVSRCASPRHCKPIAQIMPVGSCGIEQVYEVTDQPPVATVDQWTYRVAIVRRDGAVVCAVDVIPR